MLTRNGDKDGVEDKESCFGGFGDHRVRHEKVHLFIFFQVILVIQIPYIVIVKMALIYWTESGYRTLWRRNTSLVRLPRLRSYFVKSKWKKLPCEENILIPNLFQPQPIGQLVVTEKNPTSSSSWILLQPDWGRPERRLYAEMSCRSRSSLLFPSQSEMK